jgi:hypothetical protein
MNPPLRLLAFVAALAGFGVLRAAGVTLPVVVVVDTTDAGDRVSAPDPGHPATCVVVARGAAPGRRAPGTDVPTLVMRSLARRGYVPASKGGNASLVIVVDWGYREPEGWSGPGQTEANPSLIISHNDSRPTTKQTPTRNGGSAQALSDGSLPGDPGGDPAMVELVFGSNANHDSHEPVPTARTQALVDATLAPRYYVTVSALDLGAIETRKPAILWTARMSTDAREHRFDEVAATLVARGAPLFGEDSGGPRVIDGPMEAPAGPPAAAR